MTREAALAGAAAVALQRLALRRPPGGTARWERTNHRGAPVSRVAGPVLALCATAASPLPRAAAAVAGLGAGVVGLYDDLRGTTHARGFRGHLGALRRGEVTSGTGKVVGVGLAGLVASALLGRRPLADVVLDGAVVAGAANLLNLLDLRPGRALKAGVGAALLTGQPGVAAVGAVLLPADLGERAMLGDAGANAYGALVGLGWVAATPERGPPGARAAGPGRPDRGQRGRLVQPGDRRRPAAAAARPGRPPAVTSGGRRALLGAAAGIAGVTVLARVVGVGRVGVLSRTLGTSCVGSVYQAVNSVPNVVFEVVAGGALAGLVVPLLAPLLERGDRETAGRTAGALLTWTVLVLTPLAVLGALLARPLVRALLGADPVCAGAVDTGSRLLVVFMPQVVLYGVGIVLAGVLQAHRRFLGPALAPLLSSLVVIAAYLLYAAQGRAGRPAGPDHHAGADAVGRHHARGRRAVAQPARAAGPHRPAAAAGARLPRRRRPPGPRPRRLRPRRARRPAAGARRRAAARGRGRAGRRRRVHGRDRRLPAALGRARRARRDQRLPGAVRRRPAGAGGGAAAGAAGGPAADGGGRRAARRRRRPRPLGCSCSAPPGSRAAAPWPTPSSPSPPGCRATARSPCSAAPCSPAARCATPPSRPRPAGALWPPPTCCWSPRGPPWTAWCCSGSGTRSA